MRNRELSRRHFLGLGGSAVLLSASAGCDLLATEPAREDGRGGGVGADDRGGREAPALAERVKSGDLPPLGERLPQSPVTIEPVERIGVYGGTWRSALLGAADVAWLDGLLLEQLVRWNNEMTELKPNVLESFEANSEGTEYTFQLRRGLKWSDGEPFTADDIVFAQNDVYNNRQIYPGPANNPAIAEKADDYTVRLSFERPEALYLELDMGGGFVNKPFHYLKKFHAKYNEDIQALVEKEGAVDWVELFRRKGDTIEGTPYNAVWQNKELPRLHGWMPTIPLGEGNRVVLERNPYYWKVDPEGRQLPYIDQIVFDLVQDEEVALLRALNGEIDMHFRHFNVSQNKPVLARNRQKGDYRFFDTEPATMNTTLIVLNLTHRDPVKREIFNNRDFRIGLSHAINRQEISDVVFQQQGEPWQAAPRPESPFYEERFAKQYTGYDVDKANEFLDRAGYTEKDDEGVRLGPNGEPISFQVEFATGSKSESPDTLELVRGYWRSVGIEVRIKPEDQAVLATRNEANEGDAIAWEGDGGLNTILVPDWYFPDPAYLTFARLWSDWYESDGEEGEKPPVPVRRQMDFYDRIQATTNRREQFNLMKQVLRIAREEFWIIGTILAPPSYGIAKNSFRNVPQPIVDPAQVYVQIDNLSVFHRALAVVC